MGDTATAGGPAPLVGRSAELSALQHAWDEAIAAGPRLVLVAAEAGGGKSTLLAEFGRRVVDGPGPAATLAVGRCIPLGDEGAPYVAVGAVLRALVERFGAAAVAQWAGAGRDTLAGLVPALAPEVGGSPAVSDRLRLFEAVTRVIEQAAARQPLVLALEDLHWSDEGTRQLVRYLALGLDAAPVLVIATYRHDEIGRRHPLRGALAELLRLPQVSRLELPRLSHDDVAELVATLDPTLDVASVARIHERSEGIPYFVTELAGQGADALTDDLRDVLLNRTARLGESAQRMVRMMSTAGVDFGDRLARAVLDGDEVTVDAALREAVDHGVLLVAGDRYAFRHALLREALHEDLLPGEHARSHIAFARAITDDPTVVDDADVALAHHWYAAHELDQAFAAAVRAADCGAGAYARLQMYERAIELWDRVGEAIRAQAPARSDLYERAARAAREVAESARGLPLIDAALAETDEVREPLVASRRLVVKSVLIGLLAETRREQPASAIDTVTRAVALTRDHPGTRERASALDAAAIQLMLIGRLAEAEPMARDAAAAARVVGDRHLEASALNTLGSVMVMTGREADGLASLEASRPLGEGDSWLELRYFINRSDALHVAGRAAESVDVAMAGVELARATGVSRSSGAMLAGNAAEALLDLGEWDRAREIMQGSFDLAPVGHHRLHLHLVRAWQHTWQGRFAEARELLRGFGREPTPAHSLPQYHLLWRLTEAELAWWDDRPELGWELIEPLLRIPELLGLPRLFRVLPVAARAARHPDAGGAAVDLVTGLTRVDAAGVRLADTMRPVAIAELVDTEAAWAGAIDALQVRDGPRHLWPYARYRAALVAERPADVERWSAEARQSAEPLRLAPLVQRVTVLRRRAGLSDDDAGGLTTREREVLTLVAEGLSNAQIGRRLFISPKTVSVHVSNLLAKLEVANRTEAVTRARRMGLLAD